MKPSRLILLVPILVVRAIAAFDTDAFSPERWPGTLPPAQSAEVRAAAARFHAAMQARDPVALATAKPALIAAYGRYAGVPEERPRYGLPIDATLPDPVAIAALWRAAVESNQGRFGWEQARQLEAAPGAGGRVPRLRVSERQIRALLQTHEAGLDGTGADLRRAVEGLDYLLTAQTSGGAFGYPFDPTGPGLRRQAAAVVARGEKRGLTMVERGWVIEDLGDGGLNFDNGTCGAVLLQGYALTKDERYLAAAVRAGAWAKSRALVPNFNYNGFSGVLLARLYRVTRDAAWLEAARSVFEFGVLCGQLPNGRWIDQHNAKIQYHAILCAQTAEYLLALREADDAAAPRVESQLRAGLDNLAAEITLYGTNNAEESLGLAALVHGLLVLGPQPEWEKAAAIAVNYVTGPFRETHRARLGEALPEPVAMWLLYAATARGRTPPTEVRPSLGTAPPR